MLFRRDEPEMVAPADALEGRLEAIPVSDAHHVLGSPMKPPFPDGYEQIVLGMGCFWGAERFFWQIEGVHTTAVGYAGGHTANPTYEEVCSGRTGHAEVVLVVYDPEVVGLDELLTVFWEMHDPTQGMRQGNDVGTQYRSAIYVSDPDSTAEVESSRRRYAAKLAAAGFDGITTEIAVQRDFYYAEDYHQQYLAKNPGGYCNHGFCQVSYD